MDADFKCPCGSGLRPNYTHEKDFHCEKCQDNPRGVPRHTFVQLDARFPDDCLKCTLPKGSSAHREASP